MTKTDLQPRVVRGRTELWVPHEVTEVAFSSPSHGPNTYMNVGKSILDSGQGVPTGDLTASLLHTSYLSEARSEPEFKDVREKMRSNWLWAFNRNLWTDKGVYVVQDNKALGRTEELNEAELEKALKGGREVSWGGIRFSEDGQVRFAPKDSYKLGEMTSEELSKDGFVVASTGSDGAEKLGEVSDTFRYKPITYGLNIEEGQSPELLVSAVDVYVGRLRFGGNDWDGDDRGHTFGVGK